MLIHTHVLCAFVCVCVCVCVCVMSRMNACTPTCAHAHFEHHPWPFVFKLFGRAIRVIVNPKVVPSTIPTASSSSVRSASAPALFVCVLEERSAHVSQLDF